MNDLKPPGEDVDGLLAYVREHVEDIDHIARACRSGPMTMAGRNGVTGLFYLIHQLSQRVDELCDSPDLEPDIGKRSASVSQDLKAELKDMDAQLKKLEARLTKMEGMFKRRPGVRAIRKKSNTTRAKKIENNGGQGETG